MMLYGLVRSPPKYVATVNKYLNPATYLLRVTQPIFLEGGSKRLVKSNIVCSINACVSYCLLRADASNRPQSDCVRWVVPLQLHTNLHFLQQGAILFDFECLRKI